MDKAYADTVRLLLSVAPDVFASDVFAMKGGTAINLFVQDMPRLSVDIDVVYLPWQTPRDEALQAINQELAAIATRVAPLGVQTRLVRSKDLGDTKLIVENDSSQVKVEVNVVFRGSVLPTERRPLSSRSSDLFGVEFELPMLARDELYASKLVAALDRQHPRDLFDVWQLYESGGISDGMVECFVVYLAGHNRPPHEVLFGNDKDVAAEYERAFVGMTEVAAIPDRPGASGTRLVLAALSACGATTRSALEAQQPRNLPAAPTRRLHETGGDPRRALGQDLTRPEVAAPRGIR
jgi:predicted nucleotidyltransferase component of viral defense system